MTAPPLDSEAEAMALPAVRAIYEANREGRATLAEGNAAALRRTLAGMELGAYDERIVDWLAGWEPHVITGVLCGLIERRAEAARAEAAELLERVLHLRMNGERAPGGDETWPPLDRDIERYLRSLLAPEPVD